MLRRPAAKHVIEAWDAGLSQHPVDRALTLASLYTGKEREALAALGVGRRDALLLDIRRLLAGDALNGVCSCASCGEANEFVLSAAALPGARGDEEDERLTVEAGGRRVRVRRPNSFDLAALVGATDEEEAIALLARRCVLDDVEIDDALLAAIDDALEQAEGMAGIEIAFGCCACGAANRLPFDVAAFLWIEFAQRAERMIAEVEILAAAYGWSESEILSMSDRRRRLYARRADR